MFTQKAMMPNTLRATSGLWRYRPELIRAYNRGIETSRYASNVAVAATPKVDHGLELPQAVQELGSRKEAIKNARPFSEFLTDNFNRQHDYLRISITERCNLRCLYCMPEEGIQLSPPAHLLTTPEIFYLSSLFVSQGVNKIRLTGGEPTVRKDVVPLMQQIGSLRSKGLRELALTTNGISLHRKLDAMVEAGLTGVNLSLDTLDPFQFQIMTRRKGFDAVMRSINRILEMKKLGANIKLKINCVVMRGMNEREIIPFIEMGREKDIEVRFIEYMPFGGNKWSKGKMLGYQEMLELIRSKYPGIHRVQGHKNDTSKTYQVPGFVGRVGFITSMTDDFCGTCNRLRITGDGNLKVCLHGNTEVSLRDILREGNDGKPIDQEAFEALKELEMNRQHTTLLSDATPLGWGPREHQLLDIIGKAVKRKKEKHAGMGELENMENRPMILIGQYTQPRSHPASTFCSPLPLSQYASPELLTNTHRAVPLHLLSHSSRPQLRLYSQVPHRNASRSISRKIRSEIQSLTRENSTADDPPASSSKAASLINAAAVEKTEETPLKLTRTQKQNLKYRARRRARRQGLELPKRTQQENEEKPQRQSNVLRREARMEARRVRGRIRLNKERSDHIMEHITKVRKRKEEYDAMPRYEQGNVMKEAARRILRESKSEMGILQVAPSAGQLALDQEKRKEVTKMRNVVRRNRQRLGKKEWQLEQMEKGQRVTNRAIDRRIQGLGRVDARIQSQWRGGQGYPADRWESQDLDMPRTKENLQHWPRENEQVGPSEIPHDLNEATDDDWAIDSVMDVRFARRPNAIQAPPPVDSESIRPPPSADSKAPRRSFSNMQAQALERALTGTTVVSSKERRQTFLERVLKPNQERDIQSEVGKSAAQIAIGKFARMKARIQSGRNSDVRYVGAPDQPSSQQFQRRTYHTEVRTNCIDAKYQHQLPYASQVQPTESSAVGLRSEVPVVKEEHVLIDPEAPVIDSDVFYRAFNEVFLQGRARITQLKGARRGRKLTLEDRHKRCMVAIEAAEPPLDIWNSLLLRWRLEIWHASVGLTENEIEEVGQVTIRRQTLARVVADAQKRRQEGRRRLRDDPLWQEIVHGRRVKDKDDLGRLGLDEEAAFVWWHVRTKYRAHTGSGTPLGDTKRQIAKMAAEKQQDNRRFAERSAAVISRAEQRLQEWEGTAEGLHRELWLIGLGVHQSNTGLRRIMDLEMVMTMDEVRGALRYWRSSRDRGRARTRLYDAFYMMQRDFHVGEEASLSSKLRQLRQFILRGDRLTTSSNARLSPEPIAQLVQATPLRNERSIAHRLAASERSFTKLSNQIDDVKMELFYIFTGQSPSDRRTMQYISVLTLRAAAQAYFGEVVWPAGAKASEVKSDRPIQNMPDQAVQSIPDQQAQSTPSQLLEPGSDTSDQQTGSGTRRLSLFDDRSSKPLVQQAGQQNSSTLDSQSEQGVEISDQQLGPGLRRLVFSNARELDIANTRPRSQRNARTPANGAGVVGRPNRPSKKPRFDDAGLISGAILRRFRQGKARYIAQLVAAERSAAANDAVQDGDEFEDGFHDFPHEADTPIYSNAAPFNSTKRLLAPLRRSVDVDELAPSKTGTAEPNKLTHLDASGEARMVSVAAKPDTRRVAIAVGRVCFSNDETHKLVTSAALKKGDVLAISRIAGIQAAKMCPSIIPLCHPIMISSVKVDVVPFKDDYASGIYIEGMVECTGPTGVEMEALTAVMGAALTVIDMVKAVDKAATIEGVKVVHKSGGKSGTWVDEEWQALKK